MALLFCTHRCVSINTSPAAVQTISTFRSLFCSARVSILNGLFSQGKNTSFQRTEFSIQRLLLSHPSDHYVRKLFWGFGKAISIGLRTALQNVCSAKFTSCKKIFESPTKSPTFLFASHSMGLFSTKIPRGRVYSTASFKWIWIWIIAIHLHAFTFSWRTFWEGVYMPYISHTNFYVFKKQKVSSGL